MSAPAPLTPCPKCGAFLHGFGTRCWSDGCDWVRPADAPAKVAAIPDTRSEEEIEQACKAALKTLGFFVYKLSQSRASQQTPGLGDLYVTGRGVLAWVEMKRPGKAQSEAQKEFEQRVRAGGGRYCLWTGEADALAFARGVMERTQTEEGAE